MAEKLLRLRAVLERTGANTSDIYAGMKTGTFPKSVPIGRRTVGWVESEVEAWIEAKIKARDSGVVKRNVPGPGRGIRGPRQLPEGVMSESGAI